MFALSSLSEGKAEVRLTSRQGSFLTPSGHETNDLLRIGIDVNRSRDIPSDIHAPDAIGDCDRAGTVRAVMEHRMGRDD